MSKAPTIPPPQTAALIAEEIRAFSAKLKRQFREQGNLGDFTPSQVAVLLRLERDGSGTVTALAEAEGIRPQSMGTIIASLEAEGLISGTPDPSDGRKTILALTPKCRNWITTSREARQDWLSKTIQTTLTDEEQQQLMHALPLLRRIVKA